MCEQRVLPTIWSVTDDVWKKLKPILDQYDPPNVVGRRRIDARAALDAIIFRFDNPTSRDAVDKHQYIPHVRRIGEEKLDEQQQKRYPARRWVVERTLSWLSKCRAILVRYDKKACNYLGMIKIACTLLWYRRCWRLSNAN